MPFNLLLFPIVGGYYIITRLERFKYINQRLDRQMILFNSIIVGVALLVTSFVICALCTFWFPDQVYFLKHHSPIKQEFFRDVRGVFFACVSHHMDRKRDH